MDLSEQAARQTRGASGAKHPWERARADFTVEQLGKFFPLPGPIVDIGCGDAYVLSRLKAAFPEAQCLGVDTAFQGQYEAPTGTEIYSSVEQLPPSARPAGVLMLMDVLEHVAEPLALIAQLRSNGLLGPKTVVFVTVPAWQALISGQDSCLGHYRRYRQRLLRHQLEEGGLRVQGTGYFFFSLLLVRSLEVILEKLRIRPIQASGLVTWRGGEFVSAALAAILRWDYRVGQWLRVRGFTLPGLSCYALGQPA